MGLLVPFYRHPIGLWPKVSVGVFVVLSSSWKVVVQDLLLLK